MVSFLVVFVLSANCSYLMLILHDEERKINIQQPFQRFFNVLYKNSMLKSLLSTHYPVFLLTNIVPQPFHLIDLLLHLLRDCINHDNKLYLIFPIPWDWR
jgi:hypothetical protein